MNVTEPNESQPITRRRGRPPLAEKKPKTKQLYTDSVKQSQSQYRKRNLDKYNGYVMKYYEVNKDKCKARMREYYQRKKAEKNNQLILI
jgi:hypothetical protein